MSGKQQHKVVSPASSSSDDSNNVVQIPNVGDPTATNHQRSVAKAMARKNIKQGTRDKYSGALKPVWIWTKTLRMKH